MRTASAPSPLLPVDTTSPKRGEGLWRLSPPEGSTEPARGALRLCRPRHSAPRPQSRPGPCRPGGRLGARALEGCVGAHPRRACSQRAGCSPVPGPRSEPWGVGPRVAAPSSWGPHVCLCFLSYTLLRGCRKLLKSRRKRCVGLRALLCFCGLCCAGGGGRGVGSPKADTAAKGAPPPLWVNTRLSSETILFFFLNPPLPDECNRGPFVFLILL